MKCSKRHFILIVAIVAIAVVLWMRSAAPVPAPRVDFVTIEGEKLALETLRGKVVLINFWATDCAVCLKEMPSMIATYRKYQSRGMDAVFIAMPYDRPDHVLAYVRRNALPFKVALDVQGELVRAFGGVKFTPTTFIVDKHGAIVERVVGEPDFDRLHALIERKLGEGGATSLPVQRSEGLDVNVSSRTGWVIERRTHPVSYRCHPSGGGDR